jgi:tripartite-type tricarboxylate transporter receptor subunit TctC
MTNTTRFLVLAAGLLAAASVVAQGTPSYPSRPIRLIVPFAPGGTNDIAARLVAEKMTERMGQPVVIDNRSGANSVIGSDITAKASPDGYTILIVGAGFAVNPSLVKKLPYDSLRDFAPLGLVGGGPYLMVVHPSVPAKTVGEFTAWAKSRGGQTAYASTGTGSPPHLAAEMYRVMAGFTMTHVPYKGGGAVLPDLIGGRVSMFFGSIVTLKAQSDAGKIRSIAVTTLKRAPAMPDVPTFIESGLAGYEVDGWYGMLAPGKTPRPIITRLNNELQATLNDPGMRKQFDQRGMDPLASTPEQFGTLIRTEITKWAKVLKAADIQPE